MISVLIPVYNTDVRDLVRALHAQLAKLRAPGEIVVLDDASQENFRIDNRLIASLPFVIYEELPANIGRYAIRKCLAAKATFPVLLFLDGDSRIIHDDFLSAYVAALKNGKDVIVGGREYPGQAPDCARMLHWKYGRLRESAAQGRRAFHSNNFCIRKTVFDQLSPTIDLTGYGHEDTLIGIELERLGVQVLPLVNPVLHEGLEPAPQFLAKSIDALKNLASLSARYDEPTLRRHVRLFDHFCRLRKAGLVPMVMRAHRLLHSQIERNLKGCSPSLRLFDLYRLAHYCRLAGNSES